jgi:hypothetical protein
MLWYSFRSTCSPSSSESRAVVILIGVAMALKSPIFNFLTMSLVYLAWCTNVPSFDCLFCSLRKNRNSLKDRYGEPERGSEWEPIKILLEGDGSSNKTNTASNTRLRLTTQVGQAHAATEVLLDLETIKQPSEPKYTNTHSGNLHGLLPVLHQSERWPAPVRPVTPVRPVDSACLAGGYNSRTTSVPKSLSDFSRPWNKNTPKHNLHGRKTLHKT